MRRLACVVVAVLVLAVGAPMAVAEGTYSPPVDGPIVDRFRPPITRYGSGNRGIDFATAPGDAVRAAADGEVVFAGRVGLTQHVVVLHGDGIRTSYSFLSDVDVRRGDRVSRGDVVGRAGTAVHFGARAGDDHYLDPETLLAGRPPDVHLIPVEERGRQSASGERRNLLRSLVGVVGAAAQATAEGVAWVRHGVDEVADAVEQQLRDLDTLLELAVQYAAVPFEVYDTWRRARRFVRGQEDCTPATVAPRRPRSGRRIAVLVGGFGSASGGAAVLDVDTRALGYADTDVAQFSYADGQAPGERSLDGVRTTSYDAEDTDDDIRAAGVRFRRFLEAIRTAHPGVPVDVIAHSQGGVVARWGLGDVDRRDPRLPVVEHLITLGSPHDGTDLATANVAIGTSALGSGVQVAVRELGGPDGTSIAAGQLAEGSAFFDELDARALPDSIAVTSIAARGDLVVPAVHSSLGAGATNVLVALDGVRAHDRLPGHDSTHRELALALAGQGPTCRSLLGDLARSVAISVAEDAAGATALVAGQLAPGSTGRLLARKRGSS